MKKLILFLSLLIVNLFAVANYSLSIASVRYVSHSGSNTPPYLTWATAADSIMSAINISSFGDTIYVANGVYKEIVTMIPGLSLIGAGMDSTIIDTRDLAYSGFHSVDVVDSCIFKGFYVITSNNSDIGYGIGGTGKCAIIMNRVSNAIRGISIGSGPFVYKNICTENIYGILNFDGTVIKNIVYVNYSTGNGIWIDADSPSRKPLTDSNFISLNNGIAGIDVSFGTKPTIANNIIVLNDPDASGIRSGFASDTTKIFNNSIIAMNGYSGFGNTNVPLLEYNNYLTGNFDDFFHEVFALRATSNSNIVKNNIVTNVPRGIEQPSGVYATIKYNDSWNNEINYSGVTDSTNISVNPMVVNEDSTKGKLDFHLQMFSPLIDAGDPVILDKDGSRSDIGLYGGPFGESYAYQDLPPRAPINLSGTIDTNDILIKWNKNTEADINHYNLYRDTTEYFIADSTTLFASVTDTFYLHIRPEGTENLYFKLTAVDNQGNESEPSEELHILLTGTKVNEQFTINNYKLFQNYPNPFNPSTKIGYRLKERGYVKLYVYDIKGELVKTLVNKYQEGGYYEVSFEVKSQKSKVKSDLASGVYIYQILVSNEHNIPVYSEIKKMILIK